MWFVSELNGKDHLERIHSFTEGRGYSFYDCLRQFGLKWFGRRSFFDQQEETGQALWMDLALARRSGQELNNSYVLTTSLVFGTLRKFFAQPSGIFSSPMMPSRVLRWHRPPTRPICDLMQQDIAEGLQGALQSYYVDPTVDIPVVESLSPLIVSSTTPSPVVDAPVRSVTPNNRSLCYMQSGPVDQPQLHVPLYKGGGGRFPASLSPVQYIDPLPMDQLLYHEIQAVHAWPESAQNELLAFAQRDVNLHSAELGRVDSVH